MGSSPTQYTNKYFMSRYKYSNEQISEAVKKALSVFDVLRTLGIPLNSGGSHYHISQRIKKLSLDTSHFLGRSANCKSRHKGGPKARSPEEILVLSTRKEHTKTLRKALLAIGRKEVCECGQEPVWNCKPLVLQIEHINGNNLDNRRENLTFLCPNCHTQTPTYGALKKKIMLP